MGVDETRDDDFTAAVVVLRVGGQRIRRRVFVHGENSRSNDVNVAIPNDLPSAVYGDDGCRGEEYGGRQVYFHREQ